MEKPTWFSVRVSVRVRIRVRVRVTLELGLGLGLELELGLKLWLGLRYLGSKLGGITLQAIAILVSISLPHDTVYQTYYFKAKIIIIL